jgi:predicted nuclease of predicted toxin-antitoxin system
MRFLIDMNLSPKWVGFLANAGFDAVHWSDLGSHDASDPELMLFAKAGGYVILTHDLDFGTILAATSGESPSVVQVRADDLRIASIGPQIISGLLQLRAELIEGALVTIEPDRVRVTVLPIGRR